MGREGSGSSQHVGKGVGFSKIISVRGRGQRGGGISQYGKVKEYDSLVGLQYGHVSVWKQCCVTGC